MVESLSAAFKDGGISVLVKEVGNVLAEVETNAANQAPLMTDSFIQSFFDGIKDNAPNLIDAAGSIVKALADGLIKLLPKQIQKPVQDTIDIMIKSFQSGGLKDAIKTIGILIGEVGTYCIFRIFDFFKICCYNNLNDIFWEILDAKNKNDDSAFY